MLVVDHNIFSWMSLLFVHVLTLPLFSPHSGNNLEFKAMTKVENLFAKYDVN